jgi:hypothetical protein
MNKEDKFEKITIDLRPYGWGIRDVDVIWPDDHKGGDKPGPDSVGTEEIKDDSIEMEDLNQKVKDTMLTGDDRVTQDEIEDFNV